MNTSTEHVRANEPIAPTWTPPEPQPGDVVQLEGPYYAAKPGARAVIDTATTECYRAGGDDVVSACFSASAFRPPDGEFVSCSGGPLPCIPVADLHYAGRTVQRFWKWRDRPRGGGGVEYLAEVNLFIWRGEK